MLKDKMEDMVVLQLQDKGARQVRISVRVCVTGRETNVHTYRHST
jgi:hypothetical protein